MRQILLLLSVFFVSNCSNAQRAEIITTDIDNFWKAYDTASPDFNAEVFQKLYFDKGTPGLQGFMSRIKNAENLVKTIKRRPIYYASIRKSTERVRDMEGSINAIFSKMKELYPSIEFPKIYFVIGAMNSGGTMTDAGLIIGTEMYGLNSNVSNEELNDWLLSVLKPVDKIPHIVAHELVHNFQRYDGGTLLAACIKEGGADYIAELVSGSHINSNVHEFANPREKELWLEFKERMLQKDYNGWLYSSSEGRPQDLGYWMGYKITKSFFDSMPDKKAAMKEFFNIKNFEEFLERSQYAKKFNQ